MPLESEEAIISKINYKITPQYVKRHLFFLNGTLLLDKKAFRKKIKYKRWMRNP